MMNNKLIAGMMVSALSFLMIGCGQGYKTAGAAGGDGAITQASVINIDEEMRKADEANKAAQLAMNEAQAAIDEISDANGNINVSLFSKPSSGTIQSKGLLSGLFDKLNGVFDKVFAKVTTVKDQFAKARAALVTALAKLDQNFPGHSAQIQQITAQMGRIDALEAQFRNSIHKLADKLDLAIDGLDRIISGATSFIPGFGWVVDLALDFFVMDDVKDFIRGLQTRLLAV